MTHPLPSRLRFPLGFTFGASTASYQIEGAWNEDGKGESIWDRFAHTPGKIRNGDTGDRACDHYHRYCEDVALMRDLGLQAYRFSIAWPRIFPDTSGTVNHKGLDFYRRLADALLEVGVTPWATLFHWDMPQWCMDQGGWLLRPSIDHFRRYCEVCFEALGDRIQNWITHNEPRNVHLLGGYYFGSFAPGLKLNRAALNRASHHMLLAHYAAIDAFRASTHKGRIAATLALDETRPIAPEDATAAETALQDRVYWMADPCLRGTYPDIVHHEAARGLMPEGYREELADAFRPMDFLGINSYRSIWVRADPGSEAGFAYNFDYAPEGTARTKLGWPITPDDFHNIVVRMSQRAGGIPIVITENGYSSRDEHLVNGVVEDVERIAYLDAYLSELNRAIAKGANVEAYFCWSLIDNLEWGSGFEPRFGLIHHDPATHKRTWKRSAFWYRDLIRAQPAPPSHAYSPGSRLRTDPC